MFFVYILQSEKFPERFYTGLTSDVSVRLAEHNEGKSIHTNKFKPWKIKTYIAFSDLNSAQNFERYLKTSSGRNFAKKRL